MTGSAALWTTSDGGRTWEAECLPIGDASALRDALLDEEGRGFAVGSASVDGGPGGRWVPLVLRNTDRGWERIETADVSGSLSTVALAGDRVLAAGYVGANGNPSAPLLLASRDSGATWSQPPLPPTEAVALQRLSFADDRHGWLLGRTSGHNGVLFVTDDGGVTWQLRPEPPQGARDAIRLDARRGWLTADTERSPTINATEGTQGNVWITEDGARSWDLRARIAGGLWRLAADGPRRGWAVGGSGRGQLLATANGGATWKAVPPLPSSGMTIAAFTGSNALASSEGRGSVLYRSSDGGVTWETLALALISHAERPIDLPECSTTITATLPAANSPDPVPVVADGWTRIPDAPLSPGIGTSLAWTGSEVLAFGGMPSGKWEECRMTPAGAVYSPSTNRWRSIPVASGVGRSLHAAVWTGSEMIVWGGRTPGGWDTDGAAFNPATEQWRALAPSPLSGRENAVVVWTGRQLFIWGGNQNWKPLTDGAVYTPESDSWAPLPEAPIDGRWAAASGWTAREVLVWGGNGGAHDRGDGAAWNPVSNSWRKLPAGPLSRRLAHGVWTGREFLIFGGNQDGGSEGTSLSDGAGYDPALNRWRRLRDPIAPKGGSYGSGKVWTGREMLVPGRLMGKPRWVAYNPMTDSWRALPLPPPIEHYGPDALWTGSEMILWGAVYDCSGDCTATVTGQAGLRYTPPG